jgi:hypothetical protein
MARIIARIDHSFMRAELGQVPAGWDSLETISWLGFWGTVVMGGAVSTLFIWWLGGWWYWLRLRWSDAEDPDGYLVRKVYFYSSFVEAAPLLVATLIYTFTYPTYASFYAAEEPYALLLLIFSFWAIISSYIGIRTCFETTRWKRVLWFLVLPILLNFGALAVIGIVYSSLTA